MTKTSYITLFIGAVVYFLLAKFGMELFSLQPSNITILWFPFAIGVIMLHSFGSKALWFIFTASFFANYGGMSSQDGVLLHTTIAAFADTLAAVLSWYLLGRFVKNGLDGARSLPSFAVYGAFLPTFVSSLIIASNLLWGGYIVEGEVVGMVAVLVFADSFSLFLLYPIYESFRRESKPLLREYVTVALYGSALSVVLLLSFSLSFLIYMILPILVVAAFGLRLYLLVGLLLLVVVLSVAFSSFFGMGAFACGAHMESVLMLGAYITSMTFTVLGVSLHNKELIFHKNMTNTDNLTQVKNVKAYKEFVAELIALHQRYKTPFSLIIIDIDFFKKVNDTYGHKTGDSVLVGLCRLLESHIRVSDALFRVGGEEFVVLLPNTALGHAVEAGEKLRAAVERDTGLLQGHQITISLGVSEVCINDSEESLFGRADTALYDAKRGGRNMLKASA